MVLSKPWSNKELKGDKKKNLLDVDKVYLEKNLEQY